MAAPGALAEYLHKMNLSYYVHWPSYTHTPQGFVCMMCFTRYAYTSVYIKSTMESLVIYVDLDGSTSAGLATPKNEENKIKR